MRAKLLGAVLAAALAAGAAFASQPDPDLAQRVAHAIRMYPYYTIWDDISFRVANGQVELTGAVNQPYKKSDIERLVQKVPGVASVNDQIKVLPLSPMDDQLRLRVARAIYSYPALSRYGMGALPSIHVIVENGHVTLAGVVDSQSDKDLAGIRASGAGLSFGSVVNQLHVVNPAARS